MGDDNTTVTLERSQPGAAGAGTKTAPQLIVMIEAGRPLAGASRHLLDTIDCVTFGRGSERSATRERRGPIRYLDLRVADRGMSQAHALMQQVHGDWVLDDRGSKNGSLLNGVPVKRAALADGDLLELGGTFFLFRTAGVPADGPPDLDVGDDDPLRTLDGRLAEAIGALGRVAATLLPILFLGETGTGKEVAARAVHDRSGRGGPFVPVNCGAIPEDLVEASLFGHRKGAFSGAVEDRPGFVRAADRGTLFLDEIGDLPPASQAALLRVLQEREVVPVGDARAIKVDLRVVAATHRDLDAEVARGAFREDLRARLSGFILRLPALRDRREDLALLVPALLRRLAPRGAVTFTPAAARALLAHDWPQNVRELELALAAGVAVAGNAPIDAAHLLPAVRDADPGRPPDAAPLSRDEEGLREDLVARLRAHHGNVAAVARELGKGRMQIHRWLKRFALDLGSFRK